MISQASSLPSTVPLTSSPRIQARIKDILFLLGAGLVVWAAGFFMKFPQGLFHTDHFPRLADFLLLCSNPLARNLEEPIVAYRVAVPVIAHALHLSPAWSACLGAMFLIATYACLIAALRRITSLRFAILIVLALSQTFMAHWTNRWLGYPDSFSHLCGAASLLTSHPIVSATLTFAGLMNDERYLFMIPAVVWWHVFVAANRTSNRSITTVFRMVIAQKNHIAGIVCGMLAAWLVRLALTKGWIGPGIQLPEVYRKMGEQILQLHSEPYGSTWPLFLLNVTVAFAFLWVYVGVFLKRLQASHGFAVAAAWFLFILAAVGSSALVLDVSRSVGFLFLVLVLGAVADFFQSGERAMKRAKILLLAMMLTPLLYYTGPSGAVFIPYPVDAMNEWSRDHYGTDLLSRFKSMFRMSWHPGDASRNSK